MADKPVHTGLEDIDNLAPLVETIHDNGDGSYARTIYVLGGGGGGGTSGTPVALSSPPAATNANSATALTFASAINHLNLQNNSAGVLYVDWTGGTASLGNWQIPASGGGMLKDVHLTAISVYTVAATNVNGTTGANIVVSGES